MILLKLHGGLGNQMFQYAFGRKLALKNSAKLVLDVTGYKAGNMRSFSLDDFKVKYDHKLSSNLAVKFAKILGGYKTFTNIYGYDDSAMKVEGNICLDGFWESRKYIEDSLPTLLEDFGLRESSQAFRTESAKIKPNSVSIHIRRGDFLKERIKVLNGKEYCERAVAKLIEKRGHDISITIFSDDKEWCRGELGNLNGVETQIFDVPGISDAEELTLMSMHRDNIISNSTFSWWAAVLNRNGDKIVITPEKWLTDPILDKQYKEDMIMPGWLIA